MKMALFYEGRRREHQYHGAGTWYFPNVGQEEFVSPAAKIMN